MLKIPVRLQVPARALEIQIGEGILEEALLSFFSPRKGKKIIIADAGIVDLFAKDFTNRVEADLLTIEGGEKAKSYETVNKLMNALFERKAEKDTTLIAMGGGTITDVVGFVASIYMRGVPLVLIPTTLLCAVDAAIGGKTAIDTSNGKNLIGTIYQPKAIIIDSSLFRSLPSKEWMNGMAEILKLGLVYDVSLWEMALQDSKDPNLIYKAMQGKVEIIEKDLEDLSIRRILNFGHTIGHALETVANYQISHGEAVMIGCLVESYLSLRLGYLPQSDFDTIYNVYRQFPIHLPEGYTRQRFIEAISHDKKRSEGGVRFVLLRQIGQAMAFIGEYCRKVSLNEMEGALSWMESNFPPL